MKVILLHSYFDPLHLDEVREEMRRRGAPRIRGFWSTTYNMWMAIEGCHRLRAAKELGLTPTMKDISGQRYVTYQRDGENVKVRTTALIEELTATAWQSDVINFPDE